MFLFSQHPWWRLRNFNNSFPFLSTNKYSSLMRTPALPNPCVLLYGTNNQVMQKNWDLPREGETCLHVIVVCSHISAWKHKNNREELLHTRSQHSGLHTVLSHTSWERESRQNHCKTQQQSWQKQSSPSRDYSYKRRKQGMSKIQEAKASIQSLSQQKETREDSREEGNTTTHPLDYSQDWEQRVRKLAILIYEYQSHGVTKF